MINRERIVTYIGVSALTVLSFFICYTAFNASYSSRDVAKNTIDKLSNDEYFTGDTLNYREANPYGSFFVGFDELTARGVPNDEQKYISDVLTNFTMYNQGVFNGKVSFVDDSFSSARDFSKPGTITSYSFEFGINGDNIHTLEVDSNWIDDSIHIKIYNPSDREVFNKTFKINPNVVDL